MITALRWGPTLGLLALVALAQSGCAVPQAPGRGKVGRYVEPNTGAGYWLYLPEDYVRNNGRHDHGDRWPLVVTFHGMKPYDNANPQIREWQQEADRYGFIVVAPELLTCDSFMQFPLRDPTLPYVQRDERAVMAIMDDVLSRTNADPTRVLATSWSSGGYMAHFMVNRYPERFRCIAVRHSNFNESLLSPTQVPKYRTMRVAIFFGENDFKVCREESKDAVEWYRRYRFPVEAKYVSGMGHERAPQLAAAFFAETISVQPKTPPPLGEIVMRDIPADELPSLPLRGPPLRLAPRRSAERTLPPPPRSSVDTPGGGGIVFDVEGSPPQPDGPSREPQDPDAAARSPAGVSTPEPIRRSPTPVRNAPQGKETPKRPPPSRIPYAEALMPAPRTGKRTVEMTAPARERRGAEEIPARIRVHGETVGWAPMWVSLSVEMPESLKEGASILWTDNDQPISTGSFETQRILRTPGDHNIEALIITTDDRKARLSQTVQVLPRTSSQPASG